MPQAYSGVDTWNLKDIRSEAKDDLRPFKFVETV
jgi:hypothetical protein